MTAVRARLDRETVHAPQRKNPRRKLHLDAPGSDGSDSAIAILDISTTGLLLKSTGTFAVGEAVELDLPDAPGVRAVVKWSSGALFGCQFKEPVPIATVSAALLRARSAPRHSKVMSPPVAATIPGHAHDDEGNLAFGVRLRWIVGLALLSWASVAAPTYLAWAYFY